jgi:hypothetical protein
MVMISMSTSMVISRTSKFNAMKVKNNAVGSNPRYRLSNSQHELEQFIQGNTVNLKELAIYAMQQIPPNLTTRRRDELLLFIALYTQLTHNSPSHRQIGMAFVLSKTTVKNHLLKLEHDRRVRVIDGRLMLIEGEYRFSTSILDK